MYTYHVALFRANEAAKLRKEVGAAKHDNIKAKQLQAEHGLADLLSANNRVKADMSDLLANGPVPEWLLLLASDKCDDGEVEQEKFEIGEGGEIIAGLEFKVRHCKRHRKIVREDSRTATEFDCEGRPLGYLPLIEDVKYQRIIKERRYHGIADIVLNARGKVRVGQGKGKRATALQRKLDRLEAKAKRAK